MIVRKTLDFIFAARPLLLLPTWSIFLITRAFLTDGNHFNAASFQSLVAVTLVSVGTYYINQVFDFQSDLINKKGGFLQRGFIREGEMLGAYGAVTVVGLAVALFCSPATLLAVILLVLLGLAYSVPPVKLKDRPIGGLLTNAIGYGLVVPAAVPGFFDPIGRPGLPLAGYFFLTVAAVYLLTIIPDRRGDAETGKITLAARMNDRQLVFSGLMLLSPALVIVWWLRHDFLIYINLLAMALFVLAWVYPVRRVVHFACKFPILLLTFLAGYYYPVFFLFILVLLLSTRIYYSYRFGNTYPRLD